MAMFPRFSKDSEDDLGRLLGNNSIPEKTKHAKGTTLIVTRLSKHETVDKNDEHAYTAVSFSDNSIHANSLKTKVKYEAKVGHRYLKEISTS